MKLESKGILIGLKPFGERDLIASIFSKDYGVVCGMLKGALINKKNKALIGQIGNFSWNARLDSQLGAFHWEPEKNLVACLMMNMNTLDVVNCVFDLIKALLPERENYDALYDATISLLEKLKTENPFTAYLSWEIELLRDLGYALDLACCSGCGSRSNLKYISSKTGRAVCETCAKPYLSKVYELPLNLNTTIRFLEKVFIEQAGKIPMTRKKLSSF